MIAQYLRLNELYLAEPPKLTFRVKLCDGAIAPYGMHYSLITIVSITAGIWRLCLMKRLL